MRAIVLGATGLSRGHLLDELIADSACTEIRVFTRRPVVQQHPKIKEYIVDLFKLEEQRKEFVGDVVYCCVGTTRKKTPDPEIYRKVDHGIPVTAAELAQQNGIAKYMVVSALGARDDSRTFYSRLKGEMEKAVLELHIPETYILQPSLIVGERKERRLGEDLAAAVTRVLDPLIPKRYRRIQARTIALAMHRLYYSGYGKPRIPSDEIKRVAEPVRPGLCSGLRCEGRKRNGSNAFVEEE